MNYPNLYRKVPILRDDNRCHICRKIIIEKKFVDVRVYNYDKETFKTAAIELLYCDKCKIAYTNSAITKSFNFKNQGFRILGVNTNKAKRQNIIKLINEKFVGFKIKENTIEKNSIIELDNKVKTKYIIYISNLDIENKCPVCGFDTHKIKISLPDINDKRKIFFGYTCGKHILMQPSFKLKSLLGQNQCSKNIIINWDYFLKLTDQMKYIFYEKNENILLFRLKSLYNKDKQKYVKEMSIIISDKTKIVTDDIHILNYKDLVARKLLTNIYYNKSENLIYDGFEYKIFKVIEKDNINIHNIILSEIQLGKGGGFYSSQRQNFFTLVDVLIFSPYTQCYEILPATYNEEDGYCFVDKSLYWRFIRKYGNPNLKVYPEYNESFSTKSNMKEESLLHSLGYSVSVKDNLGRIIRRELLADIIDLNLITAKSICDTLNYCIKLHSAEKYELARLKWEDDMEFVINYVSKPERFMIIDYDKQK